MQWYRAAEEHGEDVPRPIEKKDVDGGMTRTCWLTEVTFFSSSVALHWTEDVFRGSREWLDVVEETTSYLIDLPYSVVGKNHRGRLC